MFYDYLHVLTPIQRKEAVESNYPESRIYLIPYGLDCSLFANKLNKKENMKLKERYFIPTNKKIILSVGAINFSHKRMDWLVQEFSKLDPDKYYLFIVGESESETINVKSFAQTLLKPDSYQFLTVPYSKMPEIYQLADYFALCSLNEGFGRVYIEAMASSLPVIAHKNLNTDWILGSNNPGLIDMSINGELKIIIDKFEKSNDLRNSTTESNYTKAVDTFDWKKVVNEYISMYKAVMIRH